MIIASKNATVGEPVYIQIESALHDCITTGEINPGEMLPSESSLMESFNASRETVRRSLKELEHKGLVYARPGKGYFVAEPQHDLYSFYFDDNDEGFDSEFDNINIVAAKDEVREALDLQDGAKVIRIARRISIEGTPVGYDIKYIPYDKGKPLLESEIQYAVFQDLAALESPLFAFYTRMEISSIKAGDRLAGILNCDKDDALLVLYRHIIRQDGKKLGYGRKYVTSRWGCLVATSGYEKGSNLR